MNAFLTILTGLIVLSGSALIELALIWKSSESRLRIIGKLRDRRNVFSYCLKRPALFTMSGDFPNG
jgi:hypothetical protein